MNPDDLLDLPPGDFRTPRQYLAPWCFAIGDDDGDQYPPPDDLIDEDAWGAIMVLPTDVALKTTSYNGQLAARLEQLHSDWVFSWPAVGTAPYMEEASYLAGEEFDALVFNAVHGFHRQAIGCLRNALEVMMVAAGLAVTRNMALYQQWRGQGQEITFGQARSWIRDSAEGAAVEAAASPELIFGSGGDASWSNALYARLCGYAHSRAGYNNMDLWEGSNGPIYVPDSLAIVENEMRESMALCYLLLRIGWPAYAPGPGQPALLSGPSINWTQHMAWLQASLI